MSVTIALQGFGPFGSYPVNPSERLVLDLADTYPPARARLVAHVLTTSAQAVSAIPALMAADRPDAWIGVGLAGGRAALAVERVAINLADYRIADEAGARLVDQPVAQGGPTAYWTTLPARDIERAWRQADVPGYISYSAGTFLCNHAFYLARHAAEALMPSPWVGFVHVPAMVEQVAHPGAQPALPYAVLRAGLVAALDAVVDALSASGVPGEPEKAGHPVPTPPRR